MIVTGTRAHAQSRRRFLQRPDGFAYHKAEWLETDRDPQLSPTVFLIEQPAGTVLATHFHGQNQFQVVVDGGGTMGPHPLAPYMVHYAGAYTGYGPIIAGPQGLKYFTIRPVFDQGAMMLSTDRHKMVRGPKRHVNSPVYQPLDEAALARLPGPQCIDLVPLANDKLAVQAWRLPPGGCATALDPAGSSGQFFMVVGGSLLQDGQSLGLWESVYVSPDEAPLVLLAGPQGAQLLLMQSPPKAPEYSAIS